MVWPERYQPENYASKNSIRDVMSQNYFARLFYQSSYIPIKHCGLLTHLRKKPVLLFTDLNKTFAESPQLHCQCYFYLLPNICHLWSLPCRLSNLQYLIPALL